MKLYNPWEVVNDTDEPTLAIAIILSALIFAIGSIVLLLETVGLIGLAIVPVVIFSRVLYAVFTGK
jgi:hypothetical protein